MVDGNPIYGNQAVTPPGLSALPYMIGGFVAPYVGGYVHPYVPPNQSTFGASAAMANDAAYKSMLASAYGQMFSQAAATAGSLPIVQSFGSMVGYSPAQIQRDLAAGGTSFGRSTIGSMLAPFADQGLAAAGLSGGSFLSAVNSAYANRFNMLTPGILANPLDLRMQTQAVGGANAFAQMLNGIYSTVDSNGTTSLAPNLQLTRGFSRETVTDVAMRMLNRGAFNQDVVGPNGNVFSAGLTDQLQAAAGGIDLNTLDWSHGDFLNKAGTDAGARVKKITTAVAHKLDGGVKALAAFRDMFNDIDEAMSKLEALTNGEWARSGADAFAAARAGRRLHAVTQMYNLDPGEAADRILQNRSILQDAAGFGADMQAYGFTGGGLFGLEAQTELLANTEDMITRRGLRGDPMRANRARLQAVQAQAQAMNTRGGVATQLLAWGIQNGVISGADADAFGAELSSGDRAVMGESYNRLLTRMFGSAARGEKMMNDATFIQAMRESLTDESGAEANRLMTLGANREFSRRELITAADNRLAASVDSLRTMGMDVNQSDDSIAVAVRQMAESLRSDPKFGEGGKDAANYIMSTYRNKVKTMGANSAYQSVLSDLKSNPVLARYYETASTAAKNAFAEYNERAVAREGLPSLTAKMLTESLQGAGAISGEQASRVFELTRTDKADEALKQAEALLAGTSPEVRKIAEQARGEAKRIFTRNQEADTARKDASTMLDAAREGGFTASDVAEAINQVADAARRYSGPGGDEAFRDIVQKSGFREKFGEDMYHQLMAAKNAGTDSLRAFGSRLGRAAVPLQENAVANLAANDQGYNMTGYFGGGLYAGNNAAARAQRERLLKGITGSMDESEFKDADDRTSLANKAIDFFTGNRNWQELINVYDPSGKSGSRFQKYAEASKGYWDNLDKMQGYRTGLEQIEADLEKDGKYAAASVFHKMLVDGSLSEKSVEAFLGKADVASSLTDDQKDLLNNAATAQAALRDSRQKADDILKETLGNKDNLSTVKAIMSRDAYEQAKTKDYGSDKYSGVADFVEGMGKDAFQKLIKDSGIQVDAESLARRLNTTVENLGIVSPAQLQKAVAQEAQAMAVQGVDGAKAYMDKAKTYADREKNKIYGELVIKDGNESRAAVLEASVGGGFGG